jgi:hypothetical protein
MAAYVLMNLDNGDMIALGNQVYRPPLPEFGLEEEHRCLFLVPTHNSFEPPEAGEHDWRDLLRRSSHMLSVFLAASRGCRLIVIDVEQLIDLVSEVSDESKAFIALEGQYHVQNIFVGKPYFLRRMKHLKVRKLTTDAERRVRHQKRERYKKEIKAVIKQVLIPDGKWITGEDKFILQLGELDADPIFDPWDDDRPY